uniref:C2H2-type domain-containing protein n=1 Tax=Rhinopithecus roxellana TaxID=61622 RepID=A0A2K6P3C8_RHIRO
MTAGINAYGHLINTGQGTDSSDKSEKTANTDTDLFVPTSSSQLAVKINSTGILQQNTNNLQGNYIQLSVSEETRTQNIQVSPAQPVVQHLQLQKSWLPTSEAQIVQGITPQTIHSVQASGQNISQHALQNLQLQLNLGNILICTRGPELAEFANTENCCPTTLTPVQTLTLGQFAVVGAFTSTPVSLSTGRLSNLQTVMVNSIDSTGIQLHPGENADSPVDTRMKEEEPDPEEWHNCYHVVDEEGNQQYQEGKGLRRIACTCPNCKEGGGRGTNLGKKKQHICRIPGCGKVYGKTSLLRAHLHWHSGEHPFRLRRTHTGDKKFICSECSKCFVRSDHLAKHTKTQQNIKGIHSSTTVLASVEAVRDDTLITAGGTTLTLANIQQGSVSGSVNTCTTSNQDILANIEIPL